MEKYPKFKAVDWAIQKNGVYIVFLTRLSPLFPFPLLNYAFGITKVKVWAYILGTTFGVLPGTIAYTYLGTLMRDLTDMWSRETDDSAEEWSTKQIVLVSLGTSVTIISILVISLITKRAIAKATREYEALVGDQDIELSAVEVSIEPKNLVLEVPHKTSQTEPLLDSREGKDIV